MKYRLENYSVIPIFAYNLDTFQYIDIYIYICYQIDWYIFIVLYTCPYTQTIILKLYSNNTVIHSKSFLSMYVNSTTVDLKVVYVRLSFLFSGLSKKFNTYSVYHSNVSITLNLRYFRYH